MVQVIGIFRMAAEATAKAATKTRRKLNFIRTIRPFGLWRPRSQFIDLQLVRAIEVLTASKPSGPGITTFRQ